MNTSLFSNSRILRNLKSGSLVASLALLTITTSAMAADAKPTAAEISKARAECSAQKQKVHALENANENDPQLTDARATWVRACGHAQDLINAASGAKPPAPAPDPNAAAAGASAPAN